MQCFSALIKSALSRQSEFRLFSAVSEGSVFSSQIPVKINVAEKKVQKKPNIDTKKPNIDTHCYFTVSVIRTKGILMAVPEGSNYTCYPVLKFNQFGQQGVIFYSCGINLTLSALFCGKKKG